MSEWKPQHPVDVLKELGVHMTPEVEAASRSYCDEQVRVLERHFIEGDALTLKTVS